MFSSKLSLCVKKGEKKLVNNKFICLPNEKKTRVCTIFLSLKNPTIFGFCSLKKIQFSPIWLLFWSFWPKRTFYFCFSSNFGIGNLFSICTYWFCIVIFVHISVIQFSVWPILKIAFTKNLIVFCNGYIFLHFSRNQAYIFVV